MRRLPETGRRPYHAGMDALAPTRIPLGSPRIADGPYSEARIRLGQAVRACRLGRATQEEVAERTGIGQTTLSAYERGKSEPGALGLRDIERACGRPAGWIAVQAGLVLDVKSVPEAIAIDPALPEDARPGLLAAYFAVAVSAGDTSDHQ